MKDLLLFLFFKSIVDIVYIFKKKISTFTFILFKFGSLYRKWCLKQLSTLTPLNGKRLLGILKTYITLFCNHRACVRAFVCPCGCEPFESPPR